MRQKKGGFPLFLVGKAKAAVGRRLARLEPVVERGVDLRLLVIALEACKIVAGG